MLFRGVDRVFRGVNMLFRGVDRVFRGVYRLFRGVDRVLGVNRLFLTRGRPAHLFHLRYKEP